MTEYKEAVLGIKQQVSALCGDNTSLSYPIPGRVGELAVEWHFLYKQTMKPRRPRPFALVATELASGRLLLYRDCRLSDFMDTAAHPLNALLDYTLAGTLSPQQYRQRQEKLLELYGRVRQLAFLDQASLEDRGLVGQYLREVEQASPAALTPYYRRMGADCYRWAGLTPAL